MESAFISSAPSMSDILPSLQPTPPPEMHHQAHLLAQYQNGRDFFTSTPHSALQVHHAGVHSAFHVTNIKRELLHDSNQSPVLTTTTPPMTCAPNATPPLNMLGSIKTELGTEFHSPQSSNNASSSTDNDIDLTHSMAQQQLNSNGPALTPTSQQISSEFAWIGKEKKPGRSKNSGKFVR